MNFNDHSPPHFHAKYGEYHITVEMETGIVEGKFPKRALRLVAEWAELHEVELMMNWHSMMTTGEFRKIAPLE